MPFPLHRPRRLRATPALRALVRETTLAPRDFLWPLFFSASLDEPKPIGTMPGVSQLPVSAAAAHAQEAQEHGLGGVILFGLPEDEGRAGLERPRPGRPRAARGRRDEGRGARARRRSPTCASTSTPITATAASCASAARGGELEVDNDATLEVLAEMAVVHAQRRRRHRRAERHDGRPRRRASARALDAERLRVDERSSRTP